MSQPTLETLARLKEIAKARVEGASWRKIAEVFGYANEASACTTVTQEHPEEWRAAYEDARARYLDEIEAEATLTQRALMRNEDPKVRQSSAHSLLHHCRQLREQKIRIIADLKHSGEVAYRSTTELIESARNGGFGPSAEESQSGEKT